MLNNTLILISVEEMAAELPREVIKSQLDPDDISTVGGQSKRRKKVRKVTPFFLGEDEEGNQNYATKINENSNRVSNKKVTKKRFVAHIDLSEEFSAPGRPAHGT